MPSDNNKRSACARTPKIYIWAREVLFLGACYGRQQAHRSTQEKLILRLGGTLTLLNGQGDRVSVHSCVVPAGCWLDHSVLDTRHAVVAIYHLAPFSQDYAVLSAMMKPAVQGIYYGHPDEQNAIRMAIDIRDRKHAPPSETRAILREVLFPPDIAAGVFREFDPRIVEVAKRIRDSLFDKVSLPDLAGDVRLSVSRLEKLFKEQAGLPIIQYRMRYRVFVSTILMALGYSITDAALCAGFASSAHLSRSYRAINGLTPSAMFLKPPYLDVAIDPSALELVAPFTEGRVAV